MPSWALPSSFLENWYRDVKMFTQAPLQYLKAMTMHPAKREYKDAKVEALGERGEHYESWRYAGMQCAVFTDSKPCYWLLEGFWDPHELLPFPVSQNFPTVLIDKCVHPFWTHFLWLLVIILVTPLTKIDGEFPCNNSFSSLPEQHHLNKKRGECCTSRCSFLAFFMFCVFTELL